MGGLCSSFRGQKSQYNAGSILDRVISQSSDEDQCLLYKLANYKKGGELIEAYNQGGQSDVERLIREQFGVLMYDNGKGQTINRAEYMRWKSRDGKDVVLPIEATLTKFDPLSHWADHDACWQMKYRGSLGETLLHVLIICDTRAHTRIARTLLKCFPRLAIDIVEGEEYLGASALHLAIAYANNELVADLVEAGAIVSQRATGSFFLPRDQQRSRPAKNTDYEGLAYLGEYPLAWAACCANESVYNLLLDSGAHPDEQDTFGNMILHMVVVCDKLDMFGYALRHPKLPARNGIINEAGLTPLTLACQMGRAEVFREMLELSAKEFWRYSNITCSAYPLNALDTLLPDGRTNWNSALFIILNGTKEEHLDMLDGGIIQRLLEEKWKTFARFLKRLVILVFHLVSLSLAVYLRPADMDAELMKWPEELSETARLVAEGTTILGVLGYLLIQLGGEIVNVGVVSFLKQLSHEPAKFIFLVSNILILMCIPPRMSGNRDVEDAILVVAVPGSWFLLMFFAGAVRLTGPFVTMVYSMITGDMLTFGIIYVVVLLGFSQSFYFLYKGFPGVKSTLYHSYHSTWMALFQITLGDYSYTDLSFTTYPNLSKTVFAIFLVLVPILLLNMLIAMMGNTYAHVIEQSEKEWVKQWAKIVVSLERAVSQKDAHNYLQEYSIKLGPGDDPNDPASEMRGVMVIKSKSKTRARQRKGAVANWKRVGKVTISELKKRGMTGEDLRLIMWGRTSFSTPVRGSPLLGRAPAAGTAGFGDALMGALDTMTFAADGPPINPAPAASTGGGFGNALFGAMDALTFGAEGPPICTDSPPPEPADKPTTAVTPTTKSPLDQQQPATTAPITTTRSVAFTTTTTTTTITGTSSMSAPRSTSVAVAPRPPPSPLCVSEDPMLDLVIASEDPSTDAGSLRRLGRAALVVGELATVAAMAAKAEIDPALLERLARGGLGLGTDLTPIRPRDKRKKKRQMCLQESSEDDGILSLMTSVARSKIMAGRLVQESRRKSSSSEASVYRPYLHSEPEYWRSDAETAAAAKGKETKKEKHRKKKPKTGRNKVAPKEAAEQQPTGSDPLEAWSTSDIKDMNAILAWKEQQEEEEEEEELAGLDSL